MLRRSKRVLEVLPEDLPLMLALSRQTANQVPRQFEQRGALKLRHGEIEIIDADKLVMLAGLRPDLQAID